MKCVLAFTLAGAVAASAQGSIVSGAMEAPVLPQVLAPNVLEDGSAVCFFDEFVGELTSDLQLDDLTISAGTSVRVTYVMWDPASPERFVGDLYFDAPILGLITSSAGLEASDALVGDPARTYRAFRFRGLEAPDRATFEGSRLSLDIGAASPGDYFRVVTAEMAVPTPGAGALGAMGMAMLVRRRRSDA